MISLILDGRPGVAEAAAEAVAGFRELSKQMLLSAAESTTLLKHEDHQVVRRAAEVLGEMGQHAAAAVPEGVPERAAELLKKVRSL